MGNSCCKEMTNCNKDINLFSLKKKNYSFNIKFLLKKTNKSLLKKTRSFINISKIYKKKRNNRFKKINSLNININYSYNILKLKNNDIKCCKLLKLNVNYFKKFVNGKIYNFYKIIELISQNDFEQTFLVKNKLNNELRSMKLMNKNNIKHKNLLNEFLILKDLDHPNILKVFEFYQDNLNFYIITEYIKNSDIFENLSKLKKFSEKHISTIMRQLFSAINYIHSKNIIHKDIKLESLALVNINNWEIKLIDFGLSKKFDEDDYSNKYWNYYYNSPELILGNYDKQCDLWSCGIILYVLIFNKYPFYSNDKIKLFKKIINSPYEICKYKQKILSKNILNILKGLLEKIPNKRIKIEDCLKHDFIINSNKIRLSSINIVNNSFYSSNQIKKGILFFISHSFMTSKKLNYFGKVFRKIDKNNDGILNYKEFYKFYKLVCPFKSKNQTKKESLNLFKSIDLDENGIIEYTEFINLLSINEIKNNKKIIKKAFKYIDKDNNGYIDIDELKGIFNENNIDNYQWNKYIKEIDKNNDNKIDIKEFLEIFRNKEYIKNLKVK